MGTNERLNDIPHAERRSSQSRSLDNISPLCQRIVPLFAEYKSSINDIAMITPIFLILEKLKKKFPQF